MLTILDDENTLEQVQMALENREIDKAFEKISILMKQHMSFAEPHNLLGIYYEIVGKDDVAKKHYRAAYALDPTYKPACRNLERLTTWYGGKMPRDYDFGRLYIRKNTKKRTCSFVQK